MVPLSLRNKHQKTLRRIFSKPAPKNLEWHRIESMLVALGCDVIEGKGSRVSFQKNGVLAAFHRPHPAKEAKPYQVIDTKTFLETLGIKL